MKTMTVRDLRQRWPHAEAMLETEGEILITRDAKPVARLVRFVEPRKARSGSIPTSTRSGRRGSGDDGSFAGWTSSWRETETKVASPRGGLSRQQLPAQAVVERARERCRAQPGGHRGCRRRLFPGGTGIRGSAQSRLARREISRRALAPFPEEAGGIPRNRALPLPPPRRRSVRHRPPPASSAGYDPLPHPRSPSPRRHGRAERSQAHDQRH